MATSNSDGPIRISKRIEKELHQSKVVIRKLPPDFTEEKLLEKLSDVPAYSYFYCAAGDPSLGGPSFSRAYFAFTDEASILPFRDKYDGWYLKSESGLKYRAVVEFAPYQGIPKRQKRKPDTRVATIEEDSDYQAFLEATETKMKPPTMAELSAYIDTIGTAKVSGVQKTPLIDYLLDRKSGRSGKRQKSSVSDSKKRQSSKPGKDSRKEVAASSRSKELRGKKDGARESREGRDRAEKKEKDEVASSAKSNFIDRPSAFDKHKERSGHGKKGRAHYEENGEMTGEGERRYKEFRVKNRDRPDQAIYSPSGSGKQHNHDQVESGRPREREGSHRSATKESSSEYSRSGRGNAREYNSDDKPRRGFGGRDNYTGSKEKRHESGRGDSRKSKDSSYGQESTKSHSSGHRER